MSQLRRTLMRRTGIGLAGAVAGGIAGLAIGSQDRWLVESELPRTISVETDPLDQIPQQADVVVIGAGIAGITTALHLNELGLQTVVFEKGQVGAEASGRNFGWVYTSGFHPDKLPLAVEAKRQWFGYADRFGFDITARRSGNTLLLEGEPEVDELGGWLAHATEHFPDDIDARVIRGAELDAVIPGASARFVAALHHPSDGTAEPTHAVPLIAQGARAEGVSVFAPVAVRGIETAGGAVHSVVTERGEVRTPRVVVATGAWTRLFLGNLGVDYPSQLIASPLVRLGGGGTAGPGAGAGGPIAWREQLDGSYTIGVAKHAAPIVADSLAVARAFFPSMVQTVRAPGPRILTVVAGSDLPASLRRPRRWRNDEISPFETGRVLTARSLRKEVDATIANVREFYPGLRSARVVERWGGVIEATPDSTSVVSEIPEIPGLFVNAGHTAQGFALGPGAGKLAAELIAEKTPSVDPTPFRFSRFHDGSKPVLREFI
ncbi:NAD(P)/FAD-dependent oxidoreductase [Gordonia sp. NPDC003376]